jgi:hypothetical protein
VYIWISSALWPATIGVADDVPLKPVVELPATPADVL